MNISHAQDLMAVVQHSHTVRKIHGQDMRLMAYNMYMKGASPLMCKDQNSDMCHIVCKNTTPRPYINTLIDEVATLLQRQLEINLLESGDYVVTQATNKLQDILA